MKIAIIDMDNLKNPFWAAGQARATREVAKRLAKKHQVTVYSSRYPGSKDYKEEGIKYVHIGIGTKFPKLNNIAFILQIPFLVRNLKADIIIENFNAPISVSFAPIFTKTPVIGLPTMFAAEQFTKKYHIPFHLIEKVGIRYYKYLLPYSNTDSLKARRLNPNIVYKIVPQGVGDEYLIIKLKKPKYILFLGRFDLAQKGIDILLKSYSLIQNKIKLPLVIAGHGPDEQKITELIKKLKLSKKVSIVGSAYGQKKIDLIQRAAFVAFPSKHEEMSIWSLEALASGLPLVIFDIPEQKWISDDVALRAKPFKVKDYAEILLKMSKDKKLLNKMRQNSKKFASQFTWERVVNDFGTFFEEVLKIERVKNK